MNPSKLFIVLFFVISTYGICQTNTPLDVKSIKSEHKKVGEKLINNLKIHKIDSAISMFNQINVTNIGYENFVKILTNFRLFMTNEYLDNIKILSIAKATKSEKGFITVYYLIGNSKANGKLGVEIDPSSNKIENLFFPKEITKYKYQ